MHFSLFQGWRRRRGKLGLGCGCGLEYLPYDECDRPARKGYTCAGTTDCGSMVEAVFEEARSVYCRYCSYWLIGLVGGHFGLPDLC